MRKNNKRDGNKTYHFSVEGFTEKWYMDWLQNMINAELQDGSVKLDSRVQKDPLSYAKRVTVHDKMKIFHVFDYESAESVHTQHFLTTLERMKKAEKIGKDIKYYLGYSNFTFELWMILHKADCNGQLAHRRQYLKYLNDAYEEHFEDLDQYKHEKNFKRILGKLSLDNVCQAVQRSERIMQHNQITYSPQKYKGYEYYKENPSLTIGEVIGDILKDCKLM